jgi:hypothetical protein
MNPVAPDKPDALLEISPDSFSANFNRRPFLIQHRLADHPLFALPELVALAKRMPPQNIKYQAADIPVTQGLYDGPQNGLSTEETIRQIQNCKSWMVIRWIENDPIYRELLDSCLNEIQQYSEPLEPGMCKREGFIFVSSPGAVTPYHMDPEYNFLLQISGHKIVHLFDPAIVPPDELEEFMAAGGTKSLTYKEEYEAHSNVFDLTTGLGLHFPVMAPHWVQNGDGISISFSITFRTPASERRSIVNDVNVRMRKYGLQPTPFGRSQLRDSAKYQAYRVIRRARSLVSSEGQ